MPMSAQAPGLATPTTLRSLPCSSIPSVHPSRKRSSSMSGEKCYAEKGSCTAASNSAPVSGMTSTRPTPPDIRRTDERNHEKCGQRYLSPICPQTFLVMSLCLGPFAIKKGRPFSCFSEDGYYVNFSAIILSMDHLPPPRIINAIAMAITRR